MTDAYPTSASGPPDHGLPGSESNADPDNAADPSMLDDGRGGPSFEDDPDPDMLSDDELLSSIGNQIQAHMAHLPRAPPIA